jgi:hypothetical protein
VLVDIEMGIGFGEFVTVTIEVGVFLPVTPGITDTPTHNNKNIMPASGKYLLSMNPLLYLHLFTT